MMAAFSLLLGLTVANFANTNQAFAWGYWNGGEGGANYWDQGNTWSGGRGYGPGPYTNGYSAGISDAVYDHDNNLQYNPIGQCLSCHSQVYWDGFHQGYDKQWNIYQSTSQSTNIYINNSPGAYVNTDQNSGQSSGSNPNPSSSGCGWGGPGPGLDP